MAIESEPEPALREDRELCEAARSGDSDALEKLLVANYDRVHALCRRMLGDAADAADATQETLLSAVRSLPRFDGRSSFGTWIYRIATNSCIDELRRRRRRPLVGLDLEGRGGAAEVAGAGSPATRFGADPGWGGPTKGRAASCERPAFGAPAADPSDTAARRVDVDAVLSSLPVEFRTAVVLRDLCDLTYEEIARVLNVPVGTVRSRI
ncbi:MAG: sigma-70 family RNA polymerase sigma factor, partial [Acidimicrobiales bacterium]